MISHHSRASPPLKTVYLDGATHKTFQWLTRNSSDGAPDWLGKQGELENKYEMWTKAKLRSSSSKPRMVSLPSDGIGNLYSYQIECLCRWLCGGSTQYLHSASISCYTYPPTCHHGEQQQSVTTFSCTCYLALFLSWDCCLDLLLIWQTSAQIVRRQCCL